MKQQAIWIVIDYNYFLRPISITRQDVLAAKIIANQKNLVDVVQENSKTIH